MGLEIVRSAAEAFYSTATSRDSLKRSLAAVEMACGYIVLHGVDQLDSEECAALSLTLSPFILQLTKTVNRIERESPCD